jgi:uncharacterized protein YaaQ
LSTFTQNDTGSVLQVNVRDPNDAVVNLTGGTARLLFSIDGGATVARAMTVTDAANGIVQYQFQATELVANQAESTMNYEVEVTIGGSVVTSVNTGVATIRRRLP